MVTRLPRVAGAFYSGSGKELERQVHTYMEQIRVEVAGTLYGGIVPHAGWVYSGRTAAHLYKALSQGPQPDTVVLFGAVHSGHVRGPAVFGSGQWRTPLGDADVDAALAADLLSADARLADNPHAHADEHSLEVQIPFIQVLFPDALIVPIAMPPVPEAEEMGRVTGEVAARSGKHVVVIGSSDLTHYGPGYGITPAGVGESGLEWAHQNDRRLLDLVVAMRIDAVLPEALSRYNACGAGAIVAAMAMGQTMGATRGELLAYTTSYDVMPTGLPRDLVGYGAVALEGNQPA